MDTATSEPSAVPPATPTPSVHVDDGFALPMAPVATTETPDTLHSLPSPAALSAEVYLATGWTPIPIEPDGKIALVGWKPYQEKQPMRSTVRGWWTKWPTANVGIVTGATSGLAVVDLDSQEAVAEFLKRWGDPATTPLVTPIVRTSKGLHIYFKHPGGLVPNRAGVLPGMDIRGDRGYVVAPGSVHESGHLYRWISVEVDGGAVAMNPEMAQLMNGQPNGLAAMPDWLLALLAEPVVPIGPASDGQAILDGQRNDSLYRTARALKARGLSNPAILAAIEKENEARCKPPLPASEVANLVENALTQSDRPDFNGGKEQKEEQREQAETSPEGHTDSIDDPLLAALRPSLRVIRLSDVVAELRKAREFGPTPVITTSGVWRGGPCG